MDSDRLSNVAPSEVNVLQRLHKSDYTLVFLVSVRGLLEGVKQYPWEALQRESDPFICETTAYRRMKSHGLCKAGVIPDFYGQIDLMDPEVWKPI
ncbi:hypothetical protein FQN49_006376 [Arthroderma sp. PD_2]|nr:hypothetical protein FQN49_006376 [Arthroderma sp. PD_2]